MDATRLHLIFNYFPLTGTLIGLAALIYGSLRPSMKVQKIGLGAFVLTALVTLVVFGTGEAVGMGSEFMIGPVWTNIQQHKMSAFLSFAAVESMGIFALFGLINLFRGRTIAKWLTIIILILSTAAMALTGRTTYFGRQIHVIEAPAAK